MTTMRTKDEGAMTKHPGDRDTRAAGGLALLALALLGGVSGGCAGADPAAEEVAAGALAALDASAAEALDEATWRALPAGCEDVLDEAATRDDGALAFAPVEGAPSLCAVIVDGTARCVDATPAVHDALRHRTRGRDLLAAGWPAFAQPTPPTGATTFQRSGEAAGDPSPQPSTPPAPTTDTLTAQPTAGEPSPQPSDRTNPAAGDPSPRPSQPVPDSSTPWSPTKTKP
jgi:hypothetical protein